MRFIFLIKKTFRNIITFSLLVCLMFCFQINTFAESHQEEFQKQEDVKKEKFDASTLIIDHLLNAYEWHIFTWKGKDVTLYLPIIIYENGHLYTFCSKNFHAENQYVTIDKKTGENIRFVISKEGKYKGKLVKLLPDGSMERPVDISITKNVFGLFVSCIVLIVIFLIVAKGYRKRKEGIPSGLQALFEPLIIFVRDEIAKKSIGEKHYERYVPYLLTLFFFILINNILGLVPIFPFGANLTGNITITAVLALFTFIVTNFTGGKEYYKEIFNRPGVPWMLKIPLPLMPVIELIGCFTKPFVLAIRLFANIMAGHIVMLGFISLIFIVAEISIYIGAAMSVVSLFLAIFMDFLELLVAFIQAYIFTLLSAIYFGAAAKE